MNEFDALPMLTTHCPICRSGPNIDCSDMIRCPLALAKFKGKYITHEEFAREYGVAYSKSTVVKQLTELQKPPDTAVKGQYTLF